MFPNTGPDLPRVLTLESTKSLIFFSYMPVQKSQIEIIFEHCTLICLTIFFSRHVLEMEMKMAVQVNMRGIYRSLFAEERTWFKFTMPKCVCLFRSHY